MAMLRIPRGTVNPNKFPEELIKSDARTKLLLQRERHGMVYMV